MMRYLWGVLALLLLPHTGWAAISWVSVTNSVPNTTSAASITTADTVNAGESIVITVQARGSAGGAAVSTVTWNTSESCTLAKAQTQGTGPTFRSEIWYCATPTAKADNVMVTWVNTNNDVDQAYSIHHVSGMATSSPVDATSSASGSGNNISTTITTNADNVLIIDNALARTTSAGTVGGAQTSQVNRLIGPTLPNKALGSTVLKTPPGAQTMSWTVSGFDWATVAVSFLPSGGSSPPPSSPTRATLGWTNGNDSVGVTTATIKRCTGSNCTPATTLTVVPASNGTAGTFVDQTLAPNTTYNWSVQNGDLAGNQSSGTLATNGVTTGTTFRRTLFTDNFDRADNSDLGVTWDPGYNAVNPANLISNRVRATAVNTDSVETYNGVATPNDQWAQYTVPTLTGAVEANVNVLVRFGNPGALNGYGCTVQVTPTQFNIYKVVGGVYTNLGVINTTATYQATDIYRCEAQGTTLRMFQVRGTAETLLTSTTDATFASGKTGIQLFVTTAGSLANAELDNFAMGDFTTTAPVAPTIDAVTVDPTGANVTWNLTTPPTKIRIDCGNSIQNYYNDTQPLASFPGGRYTHTWLNGLTYCGFHAINALGIETTLPTTAYQYKNMTGVVSPLDLAPPVVSGCMPSTDLPFGTTSSILSCTLDKPAQCAYDSTDIAYNLMVGVMTTQSLRCSATISGLTNGSTTTKYVRAQSVDALGGDVDPLTGLVNGGHPTLTSQPVTLHVLASAGADTTAPSTVTNLVASLDASGQVATLNWTPATDNVAVADYQIYQSTDACVTPVLAATTTLTTYALNALMPSTGYCVEIKARDTSNNLSAAYSNQASLTTSALLDVTPPSTMTGLGLLAYKSSVVLFWDLGTDNSGVVTSSLESCMVVAPSTDCSNFVQFSSLLSNTILALSLQSSTSYCFRGKNVDPSGNVGGYSAVVCGTTASAGVDNPRTPYAFGQGPNALVIPRSPISIPRSPRQ